MLVTAMNPHARRQNAAREQKLPTRDPKLPGLDFRAVAGPPVVFRGVALLFSYFQTFRLWVDLDTVLNAAWRFESYFLHSRHQRRWFDP
jgi:hypothetical protein